MVMESKLHVPMGLRVRGSQGGLDGGQHCNLAYPMC